METFEAVRTVLAVRAYQDTPLPQDVVHRILESGRLTGSGSNTQRWNFIVIQDRDIIQKLGQMAPSGPYLSQAPVAVVVAIEDSQFGISDASRAIQSMMLTAWSEGVGSNWVGWLGNPPGVKELLGIPSELQVIGIIPFGYPAAKLGRGKKIAGHSGRLCTASASGSPSRNWLAEAGSDPKTPVLLEMFMHEPVRQQRTQLNLPVQGQAEEVAGYNAQTTR
jgi:nitroreductase